MVFCQKSNFLSTSYVFRENQARKDRFLIFWIKKCFLDMKKEVLKKSNKWKFSKGVSPWIFSKNRAFCHVLCFFGAANQARKNSFLVFWIKFSKGASLWFLSKNRTFYRQCFLGK